MTAMVPVDLLTQTVALVRAEMDPSLPISARLRTIWAGACASIDLGSADVIESEFLMLARECGLYRDLGRTAESDIKHILRWAMLGRDPFGN